jgi:hypothetical protein
MKNLIQEYQKKVDAIDSQIKEKVRIIRATWKDPERVIDNEMAIIENKVLDAKRQLLIQVIKDIENNELLIACTELNEGDSFAHVTDVVTMISKAGNILEMKARNKGNTSVIAHAMQNIANNINKALKKA